MEIVRWIEDDFLGEVEENRMWKEWWWWLIWEGM
jgi:hypothetical protein